MEPEAAPGTHTRGTILRNITIALLIPAFITVCLRVYVRGRVIKSLGWDDILMVASMFSFSIFCVTVFVMVSYGVGSHLPEGPALKPAVKWFIVDEVFYSLTILLLKISLGIFFLRLVVKRWQRRLVILFTFIATIVNFSSILFAIFMCGNPKDFMEHVVIYKCASPSAQLGMAYQQAGVNAFTDWFFAVLPFSILRKSNMDRRAKYSVGFILMLGTLGSICAVVRLGYIDGLAAGSDFFYRIFNVGIISTCELALGITAGSLATLRPLFKKYFPRAQATARFATSWISSRRSSPQSGRKSDLSSKRKASQGQGSLPLSWKAVSGGSSTTTHSGTIRTGNPNRYIPLSSRLRPVSPIDVTAQGNQSIGTGLDTFWVDDVEKGDASSQRSYFSGKGISKTVDVDVSYDDFTGPDHVAYMQQQPGYPPPVKRSLSGRR